MKSIPLIRASRCTRPVSRLTSRARPLILTCIAAVLAGGCATSVNGGSTYRVYFLGGQSNMDGYGFNKDLSEGDAGPFPDVMIFTGQTALDNKPDGGIGTWQPLQAGFGTGFKTDGSSNSLSDRFGPELLFGKTMAEKSGLPRIALIKYSLGGSGLEQGVGFGNWHPDFSDGAGRNQYDNALETLRNAYSVTDIDGDGAPDRLVPAGIVWMQGEADAYHSQASANAYLGNLKRMMGLLRAAMRVDDLPLVIGRITDSGMSEDGSVMDFIETVQAAQKNFVASDPCAAYVTVTDDLEYLDDGWHYDSAGFVRMGAAFAESMIALEKECGHAE